MQQPSSICRPVHEKTRRPVLCVIALFGLTQRTPCKQQGLSPWPNKVWLILVMSSKLTLKQSLSRFVM